MYLPENRSITLNLFCKVNMTLTTEQDKDVTRKNNYRSIYLISTDDQILTVSKKTKWAYVCKAGWTVEN